MWEMNGKRFYTKTDLAQYVGISFSILTSLMNKHKDINVLMSKLSELRELIIFKQKLADKLSKYFNSDLTVDDLRANKLINLGIKGCFIGLPLNDYLKVIDYAVDGGYMWLVESKSKSFKFEGLTYANTKSFFDDMRIIQLTLFRELVKNGGDLANAVNKTKCDPEYRVRTTYYIHGKYYNSTSEVSKVFGVNPISFKKQYQKHQDAEKALQLTLSAKEVRNGNHNPLRNRFPLTVGDTTLWSVNQIAKLLNVSYDKVKYLCLTEDGINKVIQAISDKINKGQHYIFEDNKKSVKISRMVEGKYIKSIKDLSKYFGLEKIAIDRAVRLLGISKQEYLDTFERYAINYDNKKFYSLKALSSYLNINAPILKDVYKDWMQSDLSERAYEELIRGINIKLDFLTIGDKLFYSVREMIRFLAPNNAEDVSLFNNCTTRRCTPLEFKKRLLREVKKIEFDQRAVSMLEGEIKKLESALTGVRRIQCQY